MTLRLTKMLGFTFSRAWESEIRGERDLTLEEMIKEA
jgi:hypothetical protein